MNNYYVYIYYDPRKSIPEPIYVGKGHGNRYRHHLTKKVHNPHFARKLQKIKNEGLKPIIKFAIKDVENHIASKVEKELIATFKRAKFGGTLCNCTDGGEGSPGYRHRPETLKLFSDQRRGKKQTPAQYLANCSRKVGEETKAKISKANKGQKRLSPQQLEKIREVHKGSRRSEETKRLMSEQRRGKKQTPAQYLANCSRIPKTKKVRCVNNNVIYDSAKKAAEDLDLKTNAVTAVAGGRRKHHKNYIFEYINHSECQ